MKGKKAFVPWKPITAKVKKITVERIGDGTIVLTFTRRSRFSWDVETEFRKSKMETDEIIEFLETLRDGYGRQSRTPYGSKLEDGNELMSLEIKAHFLVGDIGFELITEGRRNHE